MASLPKHIMSLIFICIVSSSFLLSPVNNIRFTFNDSYNLPYLQLPNISAVINDSSDPASKKGIAFLIKDNAAPIPAAGYTITALAGNTSVVENNKISIVKSDGAATASITPSGIGYTDIVFTLQYQTTTQTLTIHYAASAGSAGANTTWHTGNSDASAATAIGNKYMLVADDELDRLYLFNRFQSGHSVSEFYYADKLDLTEGSAPYYKEVDVEAGVSSPRIAGRTYWTGSMSNSANFNYKPNRNHLFAVDITSTGSQAKCSFAGYYDNLRQSLINWGNDNNYKFGKSAAVGQNPKADDGFNVEGMAFAPDSTTLYIGFRAPLVPVSGRKNAVIAPIQNFESWFNNGKIKSKPTIGKPIELNLDGRSIRDMIRLSNGIYIIIAGASDEKKRGAVYKWTGNATDSASLLPGFDISHLNAEAVLEMDDEKGNLIPNKLQVLSDNGSTVYYNDNLPAKEIGQTNFRKFRSDIIMSPDPVLTKTGK